MTVNKRGQVVTVVEVLTGGDWHERWHLVTVMREGGAGGYTLRDCLLKIKKGRPILTRLPR